MKLRSLIAIGLAAVLTIGASPVQALDETCSIDGGSADTMHVEDMLGDGTVDDVGDDVARNDPADLLGAWFQRDDDGKVTAHFQVAQLTGTESNVVYYFLWNWVGGEPTKVRRWVAAQPRVYGGRYRYGYLDTTTPGVSTLVSEGDVSGGVTVGAPGEAFVEVPLDKMGKPQPGDVLNNILVQARVLIGQPGLPPGVWPEAAGPERSGLVSTVDDSANANVCDFIEV